MIVSAIAKNIRLSERKVKFVLNLIRGLNVEKALDILTFSRKKSSFFVKKLLRSVISSAEYNHGLDIDNLFIYSIYVTRAGNLKRLRTRAKGRSNKILKRSCHIFIKVKEGK
mgnify:CR=1 FL=1